jgi:hypothetical protein
VHCFSIDHKIGEEVIRIKRRQSLFPPEKQISMSRSSQRPAADAANHLRWEQRICSRVLRYIDSPRDSRRITIKGPEKSREEPLEGSEVTSKIERSRAILNLSSAAGHFPIHNNNQIK